MKPQLTEIREKLQEKIRIYQEMKNFHGILNNEDILNYLHNVRALGMINADTEGYTLNAGVKLSDDIKYSNEEAQRIHSKTERYLRSV